MAFSNMIAKRKPKDSRGAVSVMLQDGFWCMCEREPVV